MRDFWIDFYGVMDYLRGEGPLLLCFRDGGIGEVLGFEVLGLLNFLGYRVDGWDYDYDYVYDYDYDYGDDLGYVVGGVFYYNIDIDRSRGISKCLVRAGDTVARVVGSLPASMYTFEGDGCVRWVMPLDLLLYLVSDMCMGIVADGCVCNGGDGSYFDLSVVDVGGEDIPEVYDYLFWDAGCLCYGQLYTRWLLQEFIRDIGGDFKLREHDRFDCLRKNFELNWEFVEAVGDMHELGLLRQYFPMLFV